MPSARSRKNNAVSSVLPLALCLVGFTASAPFLCLDSMLKHRRTNKLTVSNF